MVDRRKVTRIKIISVREIAKDDRSRKERLRKMIKNLYRLRKRSRENGEDCHRNRIDSLNHRENRR